MRFVPIALSLLVFSVPGLAQVTPTQPGLGQRTQSPEALFQGMNQENPEQEMARLIAAADAYPLGTVENPIRVGGPEGERAFLARLSCADGTPIRLDQPASFGGRGRGPGARGTRGATTAPAAPAGN